MFLREEGQYDQPEINAGHIVYFRNIGSAVRLLRMHFAEEGSGLMNIIL